MSNKKCTAAGFEPATSRAGHPYYNHYATNPESRNLHAINYMIASVFASNLVNLTSNPAGFDQIFSKTHQSPSLHWCRFDQTLPAFGQTAQNAVPSNPAENVILSLFDSFDY